jgi:hypothetical protein
LHYERLFPGATVYDNALGGKVFVFSGTPRAEFDLKEAFSFLNYSRKQQLIRMLKEAGEAPLYYPGDEEVYFRAADTEDGGLFCAIFNLSCDPIEETVLACERELTQIERLMPDGSLSAVSFKRREDETYALELVCEHLYPVVLFLR